MMITPTASLRMSEASFGASQQSAFCFSSTLTLVQITRNRTHYVFKKNSFCSFRQKSFDVLKSVLKIEVSGGRLVTSYWFLSSPRVIN